MDSATKKYEREFFLSMIAYGILIVFSKLLLNNVTDARWRFAVALLPLIPVIFLVLFFMRYLGSIDEFQQRLQLQAIGFSAGVTALVTLAYGFLELIGFPQFPIFFVFPMMVILWGIRLSYLSRKYE